jgi:hypothetical protein
MRELMDVYDWNFDEYLRQQLATIGPVNEVLARLAFERTLRDQFGPAIEKGLRRLDRLPRDDPFWNGKNHLPTIHKLEDFAREHPEDRELAMASLFLDLQTSAPGLPDHRLWRLDETFPIEWLIETGWLLFQGSLQAVPVMPLARVLGRADECRAIFAQLSANASFANWTKRELS